MQSYYISINYRSYIKLHIDLMKILSYTNFKLHFFDYYLPSSLGVWGGLSSPIPLSRSQLSLIRFFWLSFSWISNWSKVIHNSLIWMQFLLRHCLHTSIVQLQVNQPLKSHLLNSPKYMLELSCHIMLFTLTPTSILN